MPGHIFLSHASADDKLVDPMIAAIQKAGYAVWADHLGLHPGTDWSGSIDQMLNECEAVIFALSPNSAQSKYCTAEWQKALMLKKRLYIARVAPITIPQTPTRLVIEQHADLTKDWDTGLAELIDALHVLRPLDPASPVTAPPRLISGYFPYAYLDLPLIGRETDMAAVQKSLTSTNRITVVLGMGGVGKTRLAVEIAAQSDPTQFSDGIIWHRIEDMTQAYQLTQLVRDHLGLPNSADESYVWHEAGKRRVLIILDNAEACKQPEAYARLINGTDTSGGTRFLMTSRLDWPNLDHRQRHDLRQPDLDAAAEILGKMIEQHAPRFSLKGHEREMAEAAQCHPRLMEYAVKWAAKFPADKVLATLHDLKGRSAEEALDDMVLRTVRQVESLPNGAAAIAALRRLAVCRGGFTYAAAETLMDNTEDLDLLVSWNLVGVKDERYEIDPLVIAAVGEDESAHSVHYGFYLALARVHDDKQDYLGLDVESLNLEAAFEWAMEVGNGEVVYWLFNACSLFLANRGRFAQRMDWLLRVKAALEGKVDDQLWANVQNSLGIVYRDHPLGNHRANLQQAIDAYQIALTSWATEVAPFDYAMTQNNLGLAYGDLAKEQDRTQNLQHAITAYTEALRFYTPDAAPLAYAATQGNLAYVYSDLARMQDRTQNLQHAIVACTEALRFYTPDTAPLAYAGTQNNLAVAYRNLARMQDRPQNLHRAIVACAEALRFYTPDAAPADYAMTQNNLAVAYRNLAQLQDRPKNLHYAIVAHTEALRFHTLETAPYDYMSTKGNMGIVYEDLGDMKSAAACWREAARVAALLGEDANEAKYTRWAEQADN